MGKDKSDSSNSVGWVWVVVADRGKKSEDRQRVYYNNSLLYRRLNDNTNCCNGFARGLLR